MDEYGLAATTGSRAERSRITPRGVARNRDIQAALLSALNSLVKCIAIAKTTAYSAKVVTRYKTSLLLLGIDHEPAWGEC